MKKLLPLLMLVCAGSVLAQTSLNSLNDQANGGTFKVLKVQLGSGIPNAVAQNDSLFEPAVNMGNGLYHVPGYMPYYPTAASIWPRVVQVHCNTQQECDGYTVTPGLGRGEYVFIQPIVSK
jgi:hypothetical protein